MRNLSNEKRPFPRYSLQSSVSLSNGVRRLARASPYAEVQREKAAELRLEIEKQVRDRAVLQGLDEWCDTLPEGGGAVNRSEWAARGFSDPIAGYSRLRILKPKAAVKSKPNASRREARAVSGGGGGGGGLDPAQLAEAAQRAAWLMERMEAKGAQISQLTTLAGHAATQ